MPLTGVNVPHTIVNPGAELGTTSGWTFDASSFVVASGSALFNSLSASPFEGSFYFWGGSAALELGHQTVYPTSDGIPAADIDTWRTTFTYRARMRSLQTDL